MRMNKMGNEIMRDRGDKEKQHEIMLLNRAKEKEAMEILGKSFSLNPLGENKKMMDHRKYQSDLRTFLAKQVQEKKRIKQLEKDKNKW